MENAKSVIDIEVNDDQFKRFQELFEQYKKHLGETPSQWQKSGDAVGSNVEAMRELIAAMQAQRHMIDEQAKARKAAADEEKKQAAERHADEKKTEAALKRQNDLIKERVKGLKEMGTTLNGMIGSTMSIGMNIGKWGMGIGLGLLGGGFFGLERLASGATQERTQSRILGVTPGQLRAWHTDLGNYISPDQLLGAASNAPSDANMRNIFRMAGVNAGVIRSGNTNEIATQALRGLSDFFDRNQGPNAQAVWQSRGFDRIMSYNDMRGFAGASPSERAEVLKNLQRDIGNMGTSDPQMKAWQDFYTQLQRSGQELRTTFIGGLVNLSGPIGDLSKNLTDLVREFMGSDGFKELITQTSKGLLDISHSIQDGSFKKGFEDFIAGVNKIAKGGEFQRDIEMIGQGIHILTTVLGGFIHTISKMPYFGGSGWGDQKMQVDGNGKWHWVDNPDNKGYGFGDLWNTIKGAFSPSEAHADTLGTIRNHGIINRYLDAIAKTESNGNPLAVSKAGAQGLFQLMPSVQKQYGVTNPFDPEQSRRGASMLIADLSRQFNGDPVKITAAYNAGGGRVSDAIGKYGDDWLSHMPNETQQYVGRVSHNFAAGNISVNITNSTGGNAVVTARQALSS